MSEEARALAKQFLGAEFDKLPEKEKRVLKRIAKRLHISRDVHREYDENRDLGARIADKVAEFGGSWTFIICFGLALGAWILLNSYLLIEHPVDPYPYIFLNLILSMLAAIQAPIIMMSQNRQAAKDRLMAAHDYEVNLKAELEILSLHEKLDQLRAKQFQELMEVQNRQLELLIKLTETR